MALYASLSSDADTDAFDIRLLKLQPSNDRSAPIYCKLVTYPLNSGRSHLYECLSYVWGSPEGRKAIYMHSNDTQIEVLATPNLHAALVQLRDPFFERILWVDAVCINQQDEREKTQQVAAMARIYGLANRVVVWLGGEVDNSALAFQELRNLSQSQQPVDHFSPEAARIFTADSSRNYNAETCNADVVLAIHALLNRPYFRRMWILQEVTAARNILFVCGEAELQTATFLSGLEALPDFDDWKLRNRIRAFILLIQRSAYRESLKSQAHLNIDTLINLIDRFHSNDATDPRDKIYALWGLCSDSTMMATMQPDYGKTWQNLLEDLGKAIFGDDTVLAASSIKQMLFVRGGCYDLGKVEDVSSATTWAMEQEIRITSMGASMFLEDDYRWSQTIKMRTAAEQIANDDIVLVLPKARRLIVARPYEYYFRIVSVVDTSSTQVFEPGRKRSEGTWVSWEPFLRRIDRLTNEVPLIWNWEKDSDDGDQQALCLMQNISHRSSAAAGINDTQDFSRGRALSAMASSFMQWDEYEQACRRLGTMVDIYNSTYGPETETFVAGRERLKDAMDRRSWYERAKDLLMERYENEDHESRREWFRPRGVAQCCARIILHADMEVKIGTDPDDNVVTYVGVLLQSERTNPHVLIDLASKVMSRGVNKKMVLDAIRLRSQNWEDLAESFVASRKDAQSILPFELHEMKKELRSSDWEDDYIRFLLELSRADLALSKIELLEASHAVANSWCLNQLIKHCEAPIDNFLDIIEALRNRRDRFSEKERGFVREMLEGNADRVIITSHAILAAVKWDENATSALLDTASNPQDLVTYSTLDTALTHYGHATLPIVKLLTQYAKTEWRVSEEAMLAFVGSEEKSGREEVLIALLENDKITINISERVLETLLFNKDEILLWLKFRQDLPIDAVMETMYEREDYEYIREYGHFHLAILQKQAGPITQKHLDALLATSRLGYAHLLNLVRYRRNDFKITEEMVLKALHENPTTDTREQMWYANLNVDDFTSCLICHAEEEVISALSHSSVFLSAAASRSCALVLESLRRRSKTLPHNFEMFSHVAVLNQSMEHAANYFWAQIRYDLFEELERMVVPPNLQQSLLLHLLALERAAKVAETMETLLSRGVMDANAVYESKRTPLHVIIAEKIGYQYYDLVEVVVRYGGAESISAVDAEGRTPRQFAEEWMRDLEADQDGWTRFLERYDELVETYKSDG